MKAFETLVLTETVQHALAFKLIASFNLLRKSDQANNLCRLLTPLFFHQLLPQDSAKLVELSRVNLNIRISGGSHLEVLIQFLKALIVYGVDIFGK